METALKTGSNKKQPTALVAGGAGFIGSHLCEALLAQGFNVVAVDDLSVPESKKNIERLLTSNNFSFWEEDINKADFKLSPTVPLTHVFHLASVEEHLTARQLSLQTLLVNSLGTKNLLDLAVERKAKFILVSSTEVFHGALSQTSLEAYFKRPSDPAKISFSEAKRFAETLTAEYFKKYKLPTTVIRIKDPYGPRMSLFGGGFVGRLINEALNKKKIEIVGDGLGTLNPTYITDIVFGVIKASLQDHIGEIFNVINPEKYTERSVAEQLKKSLGGVEIILKKGEEFILPTYPLIIDPTEEKLGWEPKVSLPQGIRDTLAFYKDGAGKDATLGKQKTSSPVKLKLPEIKIGVRKKRQKLLIRLIISAVCLLTLWIFALPAAMLVTNVYTGNQNIQRANENLLADKPSISSQEAKRAETSFKNSQTNIQNIFWVNCHPKLKGPAGEVKNYLFAAENAASSMKSSALALNEITEAGSASVPEEALKKIVAAQSYIDSAKRSLEISESVSVDKRELPAQLRKPLQRLEKIKKELREILTSLESSLRS